MLLGVNGASRLCASVRAPSQQWPAALPTWMMGANESPPNSGLTVSASAPRPGTSPNGVGVAPKKAWA